MSDTRRVALPLTVTFAVQALVAFAVYCAPVMAPVAGPALGFAASAVGYYIAATYFGSMIGSAAAVIRADANKIRLGSGEERTSSQR